jgi:hypothetical protein
MRNILLVLLLCSFAYSAITLTSMDVMIDVNEDGSAEITENLGLIITTEYHISLYKSGLSQNDLASWSELTGLQDVRCHVDNRYVDISNVVVRPQPVYQCNPLADLCHGQLKISYHVNGYLDKDGNIINDTGLFLLDEYKPRTTRYSLNPSALGFEESGLGDVILGETERLSIVLPEDAETIEVNPLPEGVSRSELKGLKEMSWQNTVLARFNIVFEREEGLDQEVLDFFVDARNAIMQVFSGPEGIAIVVLIVIVIGGYLHLQTRVKKVAK